MKKYAARFSEMYVNFDMITRHRITEILFNSDHWKELRCHETREYFGGKSLQLVPILVKASVIENFNELCGSGHKVKIVFLLCRVK
jgi:hypothetical protein